MNTEKTKPECCDPRSGRTPKKGILGGLLYGLMPHSFCILFVVFSVFGAAAGATLVKKFLILPYFFPILIFLSVVFSGLSAVFYLKKSGRLSWPGVKKSRRYLTVLFSTTLLVNALFFFFIFPAATNFQAGSRKEAAAGDATLDIRVAIPCSGHAPLIVDGLKKDPGVKNIVFRQPTDFIVTYDGAKTSRQKIIALDIFKEFKAEIK